MLAAAVSTYINRFAVLPGSRAVVFTNNDGGYQSALDLADAGAKLVVVVDPRPGTDGTLPALVAGRGIRVLFGTVVTRAHGRGRVAGVSVAPLTGDFVGRASRLECDLVAVSGGWSPVVHLHSQSGGRPVWDEVRACFVPGKSLQPECSVGAGRRCGDRRGDPDDRGHRVRVEGRHQSRSAR